MLADLESSEDQSAALWRAAFLLGPHVVGGAGGPLGSLYKGTAAIGLPWWLSGKEHACQCQRHRRYGFDPCTGRIP